MFLKLLYIVYISSYKTIIKLHRLCLGVNRGGGGGKTTLSPTFSCNGNNHIPMTYYFLKYDKLKKCFRKCTKLCDTYIVHKFSKALGRGGGYRKSPRDVLNN